MHSVRWGIAAPPFEFRQKSYLSRPQGILVDPYSLHFETLYTTFHTCMESDNFNAPMFIYNTSILVNDEVPS